MKLVTPFDDVALHGVVGSINIPGATDVVLSLEQRRSAFLALSVKTAGVSPTVLVEGPHAMTASTPTHDVQIPRARFRHANGAIGAGNAQLDGTADELLISRRGASFPRGANAVFVLQGLAFFFSGTATSWRVAFGGRTWTLALRSHDFFQLNTELRSANHALMACSLTTVVADDEDVAAAEKLVHHACDLLSYAVNTEVRIARIVVDDGDERGPFFVKLRSEDAPGTPAAQLVRVDDEYDGGVKVLLEHALDRLVAIRDTYRLNGVMSLARFARSRRDAPKVRALFVANALEVLRFNYGHNVLVPAGRATADDEDLCWLPAPGATKGKKASFASLLEDLAKTVGVPWDSRYRGLRNSVVHTGELPPGFLMTDVWTALHFVDSVVLSLLNWDMAPKATERFGPGGYYTPCTQFLVPPPSLGNNVILFRRDPSTAP